MVDKVLLKDDDKIIDLTSLLCHCVITLSLHCCLPGDSNPLLEPELIYHQINSLERTSIRLIHNHGIKRWSVWGLIMQIFAVFSFDILNKLLNKLSSCQWFVTSWDYIMWHHCNIHSICRWPFPGCTERKPRWQREHRVYQRQLYTCEWLYILHVNNNFCRTIRNT